MVKPAQIGKFFLTFWSQKSCSIEVKIINFLYQSKSFKTNILWFQPCPSICPYVTYLFQEQLIAFFGKFAWNLDINKVRKATEPKFWKRFYLVPQARFLAHWTFALAKGSYNFSFVHPFVCLSLHSFVRSSLTLFSQETFISFFLIFCMMFSHHKYSKVTGWIFEKNATSAPGSIFCSFWA